MDTANTTVTQATNILHFLTGLCSHSCPPIILISARIIIVDINQIMSLSHIKSSNGFPLDLKQTNLTYKALHDLALFTFQILFHIASLPPAHYASTSLAFFLVLTLAKLILALGPLYLLFLRPRMFFQVAGWLVPSYLSGLNSNSISLNLKCHAHYFPPAPQHTHALHHITTLSGFTLSQYHLPLSKIILFVYFVFSLSYPLECRFLENKNLVCLVYYSIPNVYNSFQNISNQ